MLSSTVLKLDMPSGGTTCRVGLQGSMAPMASHTWRRIVSPPLNVCPICGGAGNYR